MLATIWIQYQYHTAFYCTYHLLLFFEETNYILYRSIRSRQSGGKDSLGHPGESPHVQEMVIRGASLSRLSELISTVHQKWCRISNMVTQKWILNGGYVSIPPLSPTSWQPQIGKMMFFSPPGDRCLEMPKALDHLAASLTTN